MYDQSFWWEVFRGKSNPLGYSTYPAKMYNLGFEKIISSELADLREPSLATDFSTVGKPIILESFVRFVAGRSYRKLPVCTAVHIVA